MPWYNPSTWFTPSPEEALPELQKQADQFGLHLGIVKNDKGEEIVTLDPESKSKLDALKTLYPDDPQIATLHEIITGNNGGVELDKLGELKKLNLAEIAKKAEAAEQDAPGNFITNFVKNIEKTGLSGGDISEALVTAAITAIMETPGAKEALSNMATHAMGDLQQAAVPSPTPANQQQSKSPNIHRV